MRGPYGKLWILVFSFLVFMARAPRAWAIKGRKKLRANEANKMFIIWFCWLFRFWKGDRELEVHMATYGPGIDQSQHAKSVSHIITMNTNGLKQTCTCTTLKAMTLWKIFAVDTQFKQLRKRSLKKIFFFQASLSQLLKLRINREDLS